VMFCTLENLSQCGFDTPRHKKRVTQPPIHYSFHPVQGGNRDAESV
jgi:hypothetical protein